MAIIEPTTEVDRLKIRLNTYSNWTSNKSSIQLATAGFIYTGITDKVECQSCGIRLYNWQDDDNPLEAHKKYAPDCKFMLESFPNVKAPPKPKKILTVKYPTYFNYQERLKSFDSWPLKCVAQKPDIMAKSGFFYIGSADRARCFHCGVTLRDWDTDDYPPCVHRQWSENCPFVQKLNVEGIKAEIEELERIEKFKQTYDDVTDGACGGTSSTRIYSENCPYVQQTDGMKEEIEEWERDHGENTRHSKPSVLIGCTSASANASEKTLLKADTTSPRTLRRQTHIYSQQYRTHGTQRKGSTVQLEQRVRVVLKRGQQTEITMRGDENQPGCVVTVERDDRME